MREFSPQSHIARSAEAPGAGVLPLFLLGLAFASCVVVLGGWSIGSAAIVGFGSTVYRMQPLTATALALVALALLASMRRRPILAIALLCPPVFVAMAALVRDIMGICLVPGLDTILFGDMARLQPRLTPQRPGAMPALCIILLSTATLVSLGARRRHGQFVVLLASLALGIAVIAGGSIPMGVSELQSSERHALMGLPSAVAITALAAALITWRQYFGWPGLFSTRGIEGRTLRTIFALCVLAPVGFALARLWALHHADISLHLAEIFHATAQITVSAMILIWAWSKLAREHVVRWEVTRALDSAPIILADPDGHVIHWSEGCERLYQWSAEEAVGKRKHLLLASGDDDRWGRLITALRGGLPWEEEIVETRRDGARLHILEQARLLEPGDERPPVVVLSMTDISERKHAEEELRASDTRLTLAVDALGIGIFEWDWPSDRLRLSGDAERLLGPSPDDIGLDEWRAHVRSRFDSEIFPSEREIIDSRLPRFSFRLHARSPDAVYRTIEGWACSHYSSDGRLQRLIGVIFDATEREEHAAALKAREAELRSILETVPDAMVTIDEQGRIRSFSLTAEQLFGYAADEVTGQDISVLIPERYRDFHQAMLARYMETGRPDDLGEARSFTALHRDGTEFPVELAIGEAYNGHERLIIAFIRNIRDQLAAQARLGELREQLLHVSRLSAMGEMAAGLAHELNQPLAATSNFLGAAEMLLTEDNTRREHVRDLVQLASGQVLRAGSIIRRVRTFVAKGEVEIAVEPLADIVSDAIHLVLAGAQRQRVAFRYALDPAHPLVLADRVQVQQVLVNVVRNAIEALDEGSDGPAEILLASAGTPEGMVIVTVSDNGPGIPAEVLERAFEPFVSTKAQGMGVGLSICKRIIESHGGSFSAENKPEGGALIRFALPAVTQSELMAG